MQILIPILIACVLTSIVYAILFAYNREKYDAEFFLILFGILIFNVPFIFFLIYMTERKVKVAAKVEEDKVANVEKVISFMQTELNIYSTFRLSELKDSSQRNHRLVYLLLKEEGYPDSKTVDGDLLYTIYSKFINPSFDLEMKVHYGFKN